MSNIDGGYPGYGTPSSPDPGYGYGYGQQGPGGYGQQAPGGYGYGPVSNPGKGFGIAAIILSVFLLWIIGLPLAIVSWVRSSRAGASVVLGVVGTVMNVLSVIGSVILVVALWSAFLVVLSGVETTSTPAPTTSASAAAPTDEKTTEDTSAVPSVVALSDSYRPGTGAAVWALSFPTDWTIVTLDEDGLNQIRSADNNEYISTLQGIDDTYAGMSDEDGSRQAMNDYITYLQGTASGDESTVTFAQTSGGPDVEFLTTRFTYPAESGRLVEGVIASRVYDGNYLVITYECLEGHWSSATWEEQVAETAVNDSF
jgi:hypothetical protein